MRSGFPSPSTNGPASQDAAVGDRFCSAPFGSVASAYARAGLPIFPTGGEDGKRPLVKAWQIKRSIKTIRHWMVRFESANIGIATGSISGLTIVDCDDPTLMDDMICRFGETPVVVATPSGGVHLYYRHDGERSRIRLEGMPVDVRGIGGLVIAPPSRRPGSTACYVFLSGSIEALPRLPKIRPHSLPYGPQPRFLHAPQVPKGRRNMELFAELRAVANGCATETALLDHAIRFNARCEPPLPDGEIKRTSASVWKLRQEGRCFSPRSFEPSGRITREEFEACLPNFKALALYVNVKLTHSGRRDTFVLSARAHSKRLRMDLRAYRAARSFLLDRGLIERVHGGGHGSGDVALFQISDRWRQGPPR